jgi:precorrin-6A/cobalt-precorrin-6A reductase
MTRILLLGGTAEAAELAARLAGDDRLETVTSLAGLTRLPTLVSGRMRRGGFGGPDGLAKFLKEERYDALIDATHPFAARIAAHAAEAAEIAGVKRVKLLRPPFERTAQDRFIPVPDMAARQPRCRKAPASSSPPDDARSPPSLCGRTSGASSA